MDLRKHENSKSTIFIVDHLSVINKFGFFPSLYGLSNILSYMHVSNKSTTISQIRFARVF